MRALRLLPSLLLFAAPALVAKDYAGSGLVLQVDREHRALKISCRAIPEYGDESVIVLQVRSAESLDGVRPGVLIDFVLTIDGDARYANRVRIHRYENTAAEPMAARQLEILDAAVPGSSSRAALQVGDAVPDFTLIDQQRRKVTLSQFAGKVVAVTFFYTTCPLPNFCFRMSNNFVALQRRFGVAMGKELVLLSVSFDPVHDQPEVLAEYARTWSKDDTGWHFLTGALPDVQKVCRSFGVNFWQDEGFMTHSLHTVVVDRQGRMVANLEGNEYTARQLGDLVESVLATDLRRK